jgi:rhodanese-related sulfurtransferase
MITRVLTFIYALPLVLMSTTLSAEVIHINNAQLQELMNQNIPIIDVRTPPEWQQTGVVQDSHLMMFFDEKGQADVNGWLTQLSSIADKEQPVILICRSGNRTSRIAHFLSEQQGYRQVYNVQSGIRNWIREGLPTVSPTAQ